LPENVEKLRAHSKSARVQLPTSAVDATLLAFAAQRRAAAPPPPLSIDVSCRQGAQQQTRRSGVEFFLLLK